MQVGRRGSSRFLDDDDDSDVRVKGLDRTGEHYLIDGVVGVFYALGAWWLVQRAFALRKPSGLGLETAPVRN